MKIIKIKRPSESLRRNRMSITSITIKVKDKDIVMSLTEAESLYKELDSLFHNCVPTTSPNRKYTDYRYLWSLHNSDINTTLGGMNAS